MATREDEVKDGNDAAFILNHALFRAAWQHAEDALREQRLKCPLRDQEMHTRLVMAEQILTSVRRHIETVMQTGKMAELQLTAEKKAGLFRRVI